jgi:hypothetical protein
MARQKHVHVWTAWSLVDPLPGREVSQQRRSCTDETCGITEQISLQPYCSCSW